MNTDQFIEGMKDNTYRSAISDVLEQLTQPPGRQPMAEEVELSAWFNQLAAEDRERLAAVVEMAAYHAIFGVMAVLDGVRVIDNNQTEFSLYTDGGTFINQNHDLHELFQISVDNDRE